MTQTKKLDKKNIEDIYGLTPMQEGMLFHYLENPGSDYYFEQLCLEIPGEIDVRLFEKAWNFVIETNEMLRAVFRWEEVEKPMQIILKEHKPALEHYDFSGEDITTAISRLEEIKAKDKEKKFDLEEPAFRVILCKVEKNRHVMIISNHHILYDGWSNGIILEEFFKTYDDLSTGKEPVKPAKTRFKEFIKWMQNRDIHREKEFWRKYLKDFHPKPAISIPVRRGPEEISDTGIFRVKLPGDFNRPLRSFVEKSKVTLSSLFYSAWGILLLKYNSREDMTYDTTVSGRTANIKGIEDIVGLFINTMPLRVNTTAHEETADFISRMSNALQQREEFENSSLTDIKEYLEENNKGTLFDSVLVIENYPLDKRLLRDKEFSIFERTRYDLTVIITMFDDIDVHFIYNKELFDEEIMAGLSRHFIYILQTLVENPRGKIVDIHLALEQERTRILNKLQRTRQIEPRGDVTSYQAPRDEVERKLAEVWASVLKSGKTSIGIDSDFFDFGGHSLKASLLAAGIHKVFHVKVPVAEVFKRSTLGELANYLKTKLKKSTEHKDRYLSVKPVEKREYYALSPAQQRFYIMHQLEPAITLLNMPAVLSYDGHIDKEQVEEAFKRLTRRHESLRTSFHLVAGKPVQKIHDEVEFEIEYYNKEEVEEIEGTRGLAPLPINPAADIISSFIRPFDLSRAPLLRAALIKVEEQKYLLVVDIHHLVSDGASQNVLALDFIALQAGEEIPHPRLQYRDFSSWQGHLLQSGKFKQHETYWLHQLKGPLPELKLPTDYPEPAIKDFAGNTIYVTLEKELTRGMSALNRQNGTTLYILLLTAINILLHKYTGGSDFIIGTPIASRGHAELENIIGLVMGAVLMRNYPTEEKTVRDFLQEVKQRTLEAYEHQAYPYEELVRRLGHKGDISGAMITPIGLNVQDILEVQPADTWRIQPMQSVNYVPDTSKLELTITALEMAGDIILEFEYSTRLYRQETIERFAAVFQQVLREVVDNPHRQLWEIDMIPPAEKLRIIGSMPRCYPLTHAQKRIYYLEKTYPDTSCNILAFSVRYQEPLDKNLLETAVHTVISRNEGLCLRILEFDWAGEPFQYTVPYEKKPLDCLDFSGENREKDREWLDQQARQPFPLFNHPLFYFAYVKFSDKESGYFVKLHHIISDGATIFLIFNEIDEVYRHLKAGERVAPSPNPSYIQYIRDEKAYWHSHQCREDRKFWHRTLLPLPEPVNLSFKQGGSPAHIKADQEVLPFPGELRNRMHEYCKDYKTSLFKLIFAGLSVYLSRVGGNEDIVIGSFSHNRSTPLHKQIIGMFVSTIPLRVRVEQGLSFLDFVEKTGQAINHIIKSRQKYPFDVLVKEIREKTRQDPGYLLNVNLIGHGDLKEDRFIVGHHFPGDEPNPLSLHINPDNRDIRGVLEIEWDYQTAYFSPGDIRDMHRTLINILTAALENPGKRLVEIELLSPEEKQRLVFEFNDTAGVYPRDKTCRELFEQQVERTPGQIALVGPSEAKYRTYMTYISYRGLNEKAHQLACLLKEKGVGPDTIVAIMVERSVEMIIGILGILKTGGAYLPIDPDYPQERIDYMLKDSDTGILLKGNAKEPGKSEIRISNSETNPNDQNPNDQNKVSTPIVLNFEFLIGRPRRGLSNFEFRASNLSSSNLAYIIYTSGTTGRPKGVMVEHRSLEAYLAAFEKEFEIITRDIALQQASYSFDTFAEEVYPLLLKGGMIAVPHRRVIKDIDLLVDFIRTYCITIIDCSPLLLNELNKHALPGSVRLCISGGDVLKGEYIGNLLESGKEVYNTYGPTETTVCATYFRCEPPLAPDIPIGKPISNYTVYILDKNNRLLPMGIPGELCIAGSGTTRGYLNNPELTADKFYLRRPGEALFEGTRGLAPLLYRTGDLARWLVDGNIQFLGRIGHQVKVRGYRIELSEIQRNLLTHEQVREAVVTVKERQPHDRYICAYVVIQPDANLPARQSVARELRRHLTRQLPGFMIPAYFVPLERIPLTPGGKIDMKALPEPGFSKNKLTGSKAPRDREEEILAIVWSEVLSGKDYRESGTPQPAEKIDPARCSLIGIDDNFFEIGGDSIKAIQISARLKKYGLDVKINDLFLHQSIRALKESGAVTKIRREITQVPVEGEVQLTPIQKWFFENHLTGIHHFNQAVMLHRRQGFDETILRKVFERIIIHHDALRMVFRKEKDQVVQVNRGLREELFHLEIIHLENKNNDNIHEIIEKEAARIQAGMDLYSGPLVRLGLFKTIQGDHLLIAIHHLVMDTVSWRIVLEDLSTGYNQLERGEIPRFPAKTDSFKYWAQRLMKYAHGNDILNQLDYWRGIEKSAPHPLPRDHKVKKENKTMGSTAIIEMTLDKALTDKLIKQANQAYNTEINHLLLTALGMAVTAWARVKNVSITLEGHGREEIIEDIDISRTVGWFTSRFPVYLDMGTEWDRDTANPRDLSLQVKQVKETLRRIPHKGIGYGILCYLTPKEKWGGKELEIEPDISFNYLGQFDQLHQHQLNKENNGITGAPNPVFTLSPLKSGEINSPGMEWLAALDITGMVLDEQLTLFFSYNKYEYEKHRLEELVNHYRSYLTAVIQHCCQVEKRVLTPADVDCPGLSIDEADELQDRIAQIRKGEGIENIYPLSPMQSGILFHYLMNPLSSAYFEQGSIHLRGVIDKKLVTESINRLVKQHDILRTIFFHDTAGGPYQVVLKYGQDVRINPVFEDISHLSESEAASYLKEAKKKDIDQKFDLMRGIPMRISLYRDGADTYRMVWSYHHILMDGWCAGVLFKELIQVYGVLRAGEPLRKTPAPPYVNFIRWLAKQDKESGLDYWREYLQGYDEPAVLAGSDKKQAEGSQYIMKEHAFIIEDTLADAIKTTASQHRVTGNEVFQTAWGILLQRYNNREDVVFASVVSGRPPEIDGIEHMVGIFINTVPVRAQIGKERTFSQLLEKMHRKAMLSRSYEYLPLADIQSLTPLNRRLINHLLIYENYPLQKEIEKVSVERCGFTVESVQFQEQTNYDFNVTIIPHQPFEVRFSYNSIVYEQQFTARLALHLQEIIKQIANNPDIPLHQIEMITAAEKQQVLYDFNRTPAEYTRNKTIHELFEQQVEKTPDNIAVVGSLPSKYRSHRTNMTYISYRQLNEKSNQLAHLLKEKGVKTDTIVSIMVERAVEMIIGILGILKAGGAYLPIDPDYPQERINYMLSDSGAEILLKDNDISPQAFNNRPKGASFHLHPLPAPVTSLAYIIYTSGSTGRPKGVMVEHPSLVNLALSCKTRYQIDVNERLLQLSSICFDASVEQIFPALISGSVFVVMKKEVILDAARFHAFLNRHSITHLDTVPSILNPLPVKNTYPFKRIISGGEVCPVSLARKWSEFYDFYNAYGPTETTVTALDQKISGIEASTARVPVGKPIANVNVYILDSRKKLVPLLMTGELYIGGAGTARGYLNQPQLTAEKFHHYLPIHPIQPGSQAARRLSPHPSSHQPIYRTGDLARWLSDGNIEFLGRVDQQVKIRGNRIEPGEIQNQLLRHEKIKDAVIIDKEGDKEDKYLCAYIVTIPGDSGIAAAEFKDYLAGRLPDYMIPQHFIELEQIPLTTNGKLDRKALPGPVINREDHVPPANETENTLAEIWSAVLGLNTRQIGVHDDFFRLGGHSLKAMKMIGSIHKTFSLEIPIAEFFKIPTIRGLSDYITENKEVFYRDIKPVETKEYYALSSAQERLYFLDRFETIDTSYHMPFVLKIEGILDGERLERVFRQLLRRHEVLRTSFQTVNNQPVQRIHDEVEFEIEYKEVEGEEVPFGQDLNASGEIIQAETGGHHSSFIIHHSFIRPFDLSQPPLLRVRLVKLSQNEHILFLDMHHIIADGTSMGIMINECTTLYNEGTPPVPRIQYKDFTQWQNHLIVSGNIKKQEEYWLNLFSGEIPRLELAVDYPRPEVFTFAGDTLEFSLDSQKSAIFRKLCTDRGITLYIGLLAVFTILLSRYSGQEDIIIGSGIAGRSHENLQEMMGLFVNMLPMRNNPVREKPVKEFFEEVRENVLNAFANQDMQFEDLVGQLDCPRDPAHNPLFDVCFVVQNFEQPELRAREFIFKPCPVENKTAKFDITLFTSEVGNEIHFNLEYCTDLYKPGTLQRMKTHFLKIIEQMVSQPGKAMNTAIGKLDLPWEQEKQQLLFDFNATDVDFPHSKNISQLFAQQVQQNPDYIALVGSHSEGTRGLAPLSAPISITYNELNRKSNQLARYLYHEKALKPGQPVGIWKTPSLNRVISILAVLKAGGAYVPIDPALPPERVKYMLIDASIGVVISEKRFIRALNRLQWECEDFHTYLCMDSDSIYEEDELEKNELMEEELWHHVGETAEDEITGGGWLSSYTGKPFSKKEMDEYGDNILKKLESRLHPRMRVLEIGCASGISMFRIAPRVGFYYGTDLSTVIIDKNKKRVEQEGHENIKLAPLPAHEIDKIEEKDFDLLIMNSVIQCFHGHHYLRKVIKKAIDLMKEKGYLFIGDIMDQEKKEELEGELKAFKNANQDNSYTTKTDFSSELFLSRGFWRDLSREYQEIEKVEFTNKIYTIENELTKFRYDALLTINKNTKSPVNKKWNKQKYQEDVRSLSIFDTESFHLTVPSDSLAYIIYTSGTTGLPKGVMVEHRSLVNLCTWHQRNYRITVSDHATLYAGFGFDASVWELFPYLLKGSCLHIIDIWLLLDMPALNAYYEQCDITISFLPTQVCQQFMELDNSSLRILLTGGDKLQMAASKRYALYNNYGPTENAVVTTAYLVEKGIYNIPIGRPIDNTRVYILERNSLQVQLIGVPGELCISGVGLARGYLNHPGLTAEKFDQDLWDYQDYHDKTIKSFCGGSRGAVFSKRAPLAAGGKIYKTGDLARWLSNGNIEFLGRLDQQVKIRGYRIEPGEIQTQLLRHEKIKDAVVIDKEGEKGDKYLCAYIVKVPGISDSAAGELKDHLAGKLPDYMIPLYFIELEQIPLTTSGKLDRKALPGPVINRENYVPPTNETEKTLAEIWQEVLGIQQPGVNDNFFDMGGDSIKAIQVTARLKRYGLELKVSDLFLHPTIKESAKCVDAAVVGEEEDSLTFSDPEFSSISAEQLEAFEDEFSDID